MSDVKDSKTSHPLWSSWVMLLNKKKIVSCDVKDAKSILALWSYGIKIYSSLGMFLWGYYTKDIDSPPSETLKKLRLPFFCDVSKLKKINFFNQRQSFYRDILESNNVIPLWYTYEATQPKTFLLVLCLWIKDLPSLVSLLNQKTSFTCNVSDKQVLPRVGRPALIS